MCNRRVIIRNEKRRLFVRNRSENNASRDNCSVHVTSRVTYDRIFFTRVRQALAPAREIQLTIFVFPRRLILYTHTHTRARFLSVYRFHTYTRDRFIRYIQQPRSRFTFMTRILSFPLRLLFKKPLLRTYNARHAYRRRVPVEELFLIARDLHLSKRPCVHRSGGKSESYVDMAIIVLVKRCMTIFDSGDSNNRRSYQ